MNPTEHVCVGAHKIILLNTNQFVKALLYSKLNMKKTYKSHRYYLDDNNIHVNFDECFLRLKLYNDIMYCYYKLIYECLPVTIVIFLIFLEFQIISND